MIGQILSALPSVHREHARTTSLYDVLDRVAKREIKESGLGIEGGGEITLGKLGLLHFPYYKMGAIDTLDLFGLDELIIFSFYWTNRERYKKSADIGANLGLHSILMGRCGWHVDAYEPDPIHARLLERNLGLNHLNNVTVHELAVSDAPGELEFIRVLGNTTGSHLAGAKTNPYGDLERFKVKVASIDSIMKEADFVKLDAEGQEKIIILGTNAQHWAGTDVMAEVGSAENAKAIFEHLTVLGINLFSQKLGWNRVENIDGMPTSYKEGSLFITAKSQMPWNI
jgi:FkbM family methyltransferase